MNAVYIDENIKTLQAEYMYLLIRKNSFLKILKDDSLRSKETSFYDRLLMAIKEERDKIIKEICNHKDDNECVAYHQLGLLDCTCKICGTVVKRSIRKRFNHQL